MINPTSARRAQAGLVAHDGGDTGGLALAVLSSRLFVDTMAAVALSMTNAAQSPAGVSHGAPFKFAGQPFSFGFDVRSQTNGTSAWSPSEMRR